MTTYTYTGTFLQFDIVSDDLTAFQPVTFQIVAADANDSFSYVDLGTPDGEDDPLIAFTSADPYHRWLDGVGVQDSYEFSMLEVSWGGGNLTYVMAIFVESENSYNDFLFYLGGTSLPDFTSSADYMAFDSTVITSGSISSGNLAAGNVIAYDSLPNVVVSEHDIITGDGNNDVFRGGIGRDKIRGEAGNDRLYGDGGNDKLWGGNQSDKLYGGKGADTLNGNNGQDELRGGGQGDKLLGGAGSDKLFGEAGNDQLFGGGQLDELNGGKGRDTLNGGKGDDNLRGGGGADVFQYNGTPNEGNDVISDFKVGVDVFEISGGVTFADLAFEGDEFTTVVSWNNTTVTLSKVGVTELDVDDFNFV